MTSPFELVTLADVKDHLNIPDTSQDIELQGFIDAATDFIQDQTGPIIGRNCSETFSGGGPVICLRNPPVLSVTSVTEYVGPVAYVLTQVQLGDSTGSYAFSLDSAESGILRRRFNGGLAGQFAGGMYNIQVEYVAGSEVVRASVRMAVLQDIAGMWQPSQNGPASPMFPTNNATLDRPNPVGLFPRVAAILSDPAKRVPAIG